MKRTAAYFKQAAEELGNSQGTKTISVREYQTEQPIKVKRYIRCLNPNNVEIYLTEIKYLNALSLGFSVRRVT